MTAGLKQGVLKQGVLKNKALYGITPTYLSDHIIMDFNVEGYDTKGPDQIYTSLQVLHKEACILCGLFVIIP